MLSFLCAFPHFFLAWAKVSFYLKAPTILVQTLSIPFQRLC